MTTFKKDYLRDHWSNGNKITLNGKKYRVGKMSYGDYFLEPGIMQSETKPFNKGTLWLEVVDAVKGIYGINKIFLKSSEV